MVPEIHSTNARNKGEMETTISFFSRKKKMFIPPFVKELLGITFDSLITLNSIKIFMTLFGKIFG